MATNTVDVILQLRRDNDYNYEKVKNTFKPLKGEVCFVDTAKHGLRCKIGDGRLVWAKLPYQDESIAQNVIVQGYYYEDKFYSDAKYTTEIEASASKLYIDVAKSSIYLYNGSAFVTITGGNVNNATSETAGVMKLYNTLGNNIDGSITQAAVTQALDDKVSASVDSALEILILSNN